jgi:hypothetical protein
MELPHRAQRSSSLSPDKCFECLTGNLHLMHILMNNQLEWLENDHRDFVRRGTFQYWPETL